MRRRRRQNAAAQSASEAQVEQSSDADLDRISTEDNEPLPRFFGSTFTTHRVSPLYVGSNFLDTTRLNILSQRLRDTLVGDVVRGVQVGLEGHDSSVGRLGPLEKVRFRWVGLDALLGGAEDPDTDVSRDFRIDGRDFRIDSVDAGTSSKKSALLLEMSYENGLCAAYLLPPMARPPHALDGLRPTNQLEVPGLPAGTSSTDDGDFLRLPLLLLHMPTPLKSVVVDFLSSIFDCRISSMRMGTRHLATAWERWIEDAGLPSQGSLAKDLILTLGFYVPAAASMDREGETEQAGEKLGIKSLEVLIASDDLARFLKEGEILVKGRGTKRKAVFDNEKRERKRLAGGKSDEGWAWREDENEKEPQHFLNAVGAYLDKHLALDLFHPGVRITKITCAGFSLAERRVRLNAAPGYEGVVFEPSRRLVEGLVAAAAIPA